MHIQHSGTKIRVFEQKIDIIKFCCFFVSRGGAGGGGGSGVGAGGNFQRKLSGKFM